MVSELEALNINYSALPSDERCDNKGREVVAKLKESFVSQPNDELL